MIPIDVANELIRVFHEHTKWAILASLPTLYSKIFAVPSLFPLNMLVNVTLDITGYKQIIFQD